ncbi:outer membrane beta-barrel protein [Chitinimonas sp. PSY-7]|uniref:outer membrane beta-barrel protein n=1 Tax=Chitinimonas sp. PSY-7 TaxID=3459088 RepID=UPI00403FCA6A
MKKQFSLLVIAGVLAAPVLAEGFYAGAEVGRTKMKSSEDADIKGNATNVGVFAGYQFHPNVAVEAGYRDLGKIKYSDSETYQGTTVTANASAKSRALHASVVGIVPVSDEFSLYGRVGVARVNVKTAGNISVSGAGVGNGMSIAGQDSFNKTKPMFGLGARYAVSKEFGVRAEYSQFGKIEGVKVSSFTVGGDYSF